MMADYRGFTFQNPSSPFQQNYNYLHGINPDLALTWGSSAVGGHEPEFKQGIDSALGGNYGNSIISAFGHQAGGSEAGSPLQQSLGLPSNWAPPDLQSMNFTPSGGFTYNGQNYQLPGGGSGPIGPVGGIGQDAGNAIGTADWWKAAQSSGTPQTGQTLSQVARGTTPTASSGGLLGVTGGDGASTPFSQNPTYPTGSGSLLGVDGSAGMQTPFAQQMAGSNPASGGAMPTGSTGNMGTGSSGSLGSVNGVPGYAGGGSFDINSWKDPGYDFRVSEGNKAIEGGAAARGNLLSGSTLKDLTNYGQNAASQEYSNAYNRFAGNRQFNYGVDTGDRNFAYNAQTSDRDFNQRVLEQLANYGIQGTGNAASDNRLLATLLSQNTLGAGNASAAGAIGGSNAITTAIQQAIAGMLSGQLLNRIPGLNPG